MVTVAIPAVAVAAMAEAPQAIKLQFEFKKVTTIVQPELERTLPPSTVSQKPDVLRVRLAPDQTFARVGGAKDG